MVHFCEASKIGEEKELINQRVEHCRGKWNELSDQVTMAEFEKIKKHAHPSTRH
jgi:predicted nuclease with TOPRIM domain